MSAEGALVSQIIRASYVRGRTVQPKGGSVRVGTRSQQGSFPKISFPWKIVEMSGRVPYIVEKEDLMAQEPNRTARIEARITPDALAVVKRAAEIQGRSVSDFVVAAAQEAAHRTIEETQIIRLSVEDQRAFAEAILNPPEPKAALKRAAEAHRRLVKASR
jgi:uncharacterized protein (DUF1778 family)